MSNKNNKKPESQSAEPQKNAVKEVASGTSAKKKKTAIIISAAAVLLVACILVGIFVVKPAIEKGNNEKTSTTASSGSTDGVQMGGYNYVDYNGVQMAEPLAQVLNQAAADSAAACEKYDVAMTLGDREISRSEFHLYYLDQYRTQMTEVAYSEEKSGANRTGYDVDKLPDEQKHPTKDMTWAEEFVIKASEAIKSNYAGFDLAIKAGIQLEESDIADIILNYKRAEDYAYQSQMEVNEYIESVYTKGLTYSMFAAREIMMTYALEYENQTKTNNYNSYPEETILKKLDESNNKYKIVKARVYPIETEYDPVEASKVSTEKEFLEYANSHSLYQGYVAETRTQCFYVTKDAIARTFGDEVGEWMFSSDRVQGETQVVEGMLYDYLCHIIELPYYSTSCHIMSYEIDRNGALDEEGMQAEVEAVEKMLEDWKNGDATAESFSEIAQTSSYTPERNVRTGEYSYEINNWLFDKIRKPGDTAVFSDEYGIYMFYYVQKNEDDYDWDVYLRDELSAEDYANHITEVLDGENFEVDMNNSVVKSIVKTANVRITKQINDRKKQSK